MLIGDLMVAEKVFVYRSGEPLSDEQMRSLLWAVRQYGNGLLCVQPAPGPEANGRIRQLSDGLIVGYLGAAGDDPETVRKSLPDWHALCALVLWLAFRDRGLRRQVTGPVVDFRSQPVRPDQKDVVSRFINLGINCELGLVQRHCMSEPLGLFRFGHTPLRGLIDALDLEFEYIADVSKLLFYVRYHNEIVSQAPRAMPPDCRVHPP
jgi:hypothetical protein